MIRFQNFHVTKRIDTILTGHSGNKMYKIEKKKKVKKEKRTIKKAHSSVGPPNSSPLYSYPFSS